MQWISYKNNVYFKQGTFRLMQHHTDYGNEILDEEIKQSKESE